MGRVFGSAVRTLLRMPPADIEVPGFQCMLHFPFQLLASMHPGKQQVMAEVLGSLLPMWETWLKFWVLGFSQAQLWMLWASEL